MKTRVLLLYGGRSGEHEISLISAASVFRRLDRARFDVTAVGIDHQGRWWLADLSGLRDADKALPMPREGSAALVALSPFPGGRGHSLSVLADGGGKRQGDAIAFDVVFPVMHGPLCEDGAIQGLFELADVPFVGCGVMASAVGMDKEMTKRVVRDAGLPIVPYVSARKRDWKRDAGVVSARIAKELGYPVFVKPATLGSSVGVHKVRDAAALAAAMNDAFRYDVKVLIEKSVNAREIEFAVLERGASDRDAQLGALVSEPGEITPTHEFYSYEAKYLDENGAKLQIPAALSSGEKRTAQHIARRAFEALECEGMARVDLFIDRDTGAIYFNEVNTIPGFTSISMYPKMMEASGVPYAELLTRLVELGLERGREKHALVREFHSK